MFGVLGLALVLLALLVAVRRPLAGMTVGALLRHAGAGDISFQIGRVSPWLLELENLSFRVRTRPFSARRVTMMRAHWWTPSLGAVQVEQARVPFNVDGSDTNPSVWSTYQGGPADSPTAVRLPVERITFDGQLLIQAAALSDQPVTVSLNAQQGVKGFWQGRVSADATGLMLRAEGELDPARGEGAFKLLEFSLALAPWQNVLQRLVLLPGGTLELAGTVTASAEGRYTGKRLTATGTGRLRAGTVKNVPRAITAEGVEVDLEFLDFAQVRTKPGSLRVRELRAGQLVMHDLEAEFSLAGPTRIDVARCRLNALGGSVAAEPFKYFLNLRELEAVLLVEGMNVADVLALTQDLPAKASGQVNGRLPVRIDGSGLRLGSGWLALKPGVYAELRLNAGGLLTGGVSPSSPSYAVLKKIEAGLLTLKLGEMRLEVRPPDAPAGRSARLHLAGEPVDPEVKAPVTLDLNVNGPLEKLLNLGIDSRVKFGAKP